MSRFSISPQARRDLKEIYGYVARDKPMAAHRLRQTLETAMVALAKNPLLGEARPDFGKDVRLFAVGKYVIFYHPAQGKITIARVVHGARDVLSLWRPK